MKEIIINITSLEIRVAMMEDGDLVELLVEREESSRLVGDIYLGRVNAILPGIQAAFVDIGYEKAGFLHANDLSPSPDSLQEFDIVEGPRGRGRPRDAQDQTKRTAPRRSRRSCRRVRRSSSRSRRKRSGPRGRGYRPRFRSPGGSWSICPTWTISACRARSSRARRGPA